MVCSLPANPVLAGEIPPRPPFAKGGKNWDIPPHPILSRLGRGVSGWKVVNENHSDSKGTSLGL